MNFDRNTIIGFIVLGVLFIGYFLYTSKEQQAYQQQVTKQKIEQARKDSIANANKPRPSIQDSLRLDSQTRKQQAGNFQDGANGTEQITVLENDLLKIGFTNKGGQPKWVLLKNFKGADSSNVRLNGSDSDRINYQISTGTATSDIISLYFEGGQITKAADGSQTISYHLQSSDGNSITHQFVLPANGYMIDFNLSVNGAAKLLNGNTLNLTWTEKAVQQERDLTYEKQQAQICYKTNGNYDYTSALKEGAEDFSNKSVQWVAVKQRFFTTALIAKNNFTAGRIDWKVPDDNKTVVEATANLKAALPGASATFPMAIYYGPADYKILKSYGNDLEDQVNLGSGIFSFVKYINRWVVIPIFDFFSKFTANFGIVILLLTLFIRLVISPLTYSSYLSGAKMKVMRPELEQLRAKYGNDQQQMSVEQMKLYREAGVNPLGGCIPGLLQIPIFFALYSFFNSNIALRGQSFLWSYDLSQYDAIVKFGTTLPLIGNHISLFTVTAVITSFLISLYSMSMTPDQNNPVLKYMPYFFPIVMFFIFNNLPSGLTWYYTVSNVITLALQFVIQNYIINHDKILAKIEENRKKPKAKSKWAERMEQMQEQQKRMQDMQNKNRK
ncbi:MAG: membrane protein insertase YidC [Chitinophagaceae bacterium]